jgi:hypothetical protein
MGVFAGQFLQEEANMADLMARLANVAAQISEATARRMANEDPNKDAAKPAQWTVYKVRGSYKLAWLGSVEARNEEHTANLISDRRSGSS